MSLHSSRNDKIMVVDDDARIRDLLRRYLTQEGFDVLQAEDSKAMGRVLLREPVDLIVLDLMLPGEDGLSICRRLRASGDRTPIIMLTAKGEDVDRIVGLEVGADDYLGKPFDVEELLARVRSLLRRHADTSALLKVPGGSLNVGTRMVTLDGVGMVALSERESEFLEHLARRPQQVFTRAGLLESVFADADDGGVVDTYVHYLRKKLGRSCVLTVRGRGYVLGPLA